MLFNSYVFVFAFLPVTLVVFHAIGAAGRQRTAVAFLVAASLFFYGWWNPLHLPLLCVSAACNFALGKALGRMAATGSRWRGRLLALGIAGNLAVLGYFKYATFVVDNVAALTGIEFAVRAVVLPLGISFFTFQKIAFLADSAEGKTASYDFLGFCLFVFFFPQLIAGPIVHHKDVMDQFARPSFSRFDHAAFAEGVTFFAIGLFKKVALADTMATVATPVFAEAGEGPVSLAAAWTGALAYTLQLYFDFSGYSDMAVGLARMFGVRLPYNFASPYKAASIVDFWRRWHMTLSRFLRDYLYIPLGGNRKGPVRRHLNLLATMVLGGLWHGAGWTFVIWGALHGTYLVVNHAWTAARAGLGLAGPPTAAGLWAGRLLTFLAAMVGWVFFRAEDLDDALAVLAGMAGANGPIAQGDLLWTVVGPALESPDPLAAMLYAIDNAAELPLMVLLLGVVWFLPNSQEIVDGMGAEASRLRSLSIRWRPNTAWAFGISTVLLFCFTRFSEVSAFLYFNF
ncbi:MAG TPA: MBOAT family protein [Azospirillaceae bacterium]|nr:MBOAT family protein [Azospirillaceae bacterium]